MSLAIAMPNGAGGARGLDEGENGTEPGTTDEQKVNEILVLVYDAANGGIECAKKFGTGDFQPGKLPDKTMIYTLTPFKVNKGGEKKVVVIVNPCKGFDKESTLASMREAKTFTRQEVENISTAAKPGDEDKKGFLMTNANTFTNQKENGQPVTSGEPKDGGFYPDGSVAVNVTGTVTNPTTVIIPVERAVAKMVDITNDYTKEIGDTGDKVKFTHVALINGNTQFFPIKNIRDSEEEGNDYVVDPNFNTKEVDYGVEAFYSRNFTSFGAVAKAAETDDIEWKELSTDNGPVFYTLENTMIKEEQKNGYTTGLYYKATYNLKDKKEGGNVYKYLGKLYDFEELSGVAGLANLVAIASLILSAGLSDESSAEEFEKLRITKYEKGVCYYPYWIRHVDNGDASVSGVMEFAVVRNNVYKMKINSVSGIGTPTPGDPDPETPDETSEAKLQVIVKVMDWTVRNNQIDF